MEQPPGRIQFVALRRTSIDVTGADRARLIHNFCTQDIQNLPVGKLREAFVTDGRGKLLGHIHVLNHGGWLEIHSVPQQSEHLISHWDRYVIREDVQFIDRSNEREFVFVFGPDALSWSPAIGDRIEPAPGTIERLTKGPATAWAAAGDVLGPGWLIGLAENGDRSAAGLPSPSSSGAWEHVKQGLADAGACSADLDALQAHRIIHRYPWFGTDASSENLPQEMRRDDQAISFRKGCYLGQETVARLDALGHVNRWLVRCWIEGDRAPQLGVVTDGDGRDVGRLTSVAWSASLNTWVGLAMVRRAVSEPGTQLTADGLAIIIEDGRFP